MTQVAMNHLVLPRHHAVDFKNVKTHCENSARKSIKRLLVGVSHSNMKIFAYKVVESHSHQAQSQAYTN